MTESMVEKVARAIWDERENTFPKRVKTTWAGGTGIAKQWTMDLARAEMKAMREPSQHRPNAGRPALAKRRGGWWASATSADALSRASSRVSGPRVMARAASMPWSWTRVKPSPSEPDIPMTGIPRALASLATPMGALLYTV